LTAQKSSTLPDRLLPLLILILAWIGWLALGRVYEPDANYVTYRFAANLAAGRGLVYLTPDPAISTYPLVPTLLAIPARLGVPLPAAGGILSILAITVGALFLIRLTNNQWVAGIAYATVTAAQPSPVVLVMIALAMAGLDAVRSQRWLLAGVLLALAILTEPSALALALLTIFLIIREGGSVRRYLLPAILIPLAVVALISLTLGLRTAFNEAFVSFPTAIVTLVLPVVAVITLARCWPALRQAPYTAILLAWGGVTVFIAVLTGSAITAAILPGLIALAAHFPWQPRLVVIAAACLDLALGVIAPVSPRVAASSEALGKWFLTNATPEVTIATTEIGALAFYAERSIADLSGKLRQSPFDTAFFARYAPDFFVLRNGTAVPEKPFKTSYAAVQSAEERTIFARVVNYAGLDDHGVDVGYGNPIRYDLHLSNVAIGNTLRPGDLVRVRLDWELMYPLPYLAEIKMTINDETGQALVGQVDPVIAYRWPLGKTSSYHLFMLPSNAKPGKVRLFLGVRLRDTLSKELSVAEVNVVAR